MFYPEASNIVIFVIMAIVLIMRPAGLFGKEVTWPTASRLRTAGRRRAGGAVHRRCSWSLSWSS